MGVKKAYGHSISEYLEYEANSEIKHEYEGGQILAMSGGTINHGLICTNSTAIIREKVRASAKKCTTIGSEVKIYIHPVDSFIYPDTMVICGPLETAEADPESITNPILVVEVLSKSTAGYDRGDKFFKYRQLPSLREYILIDQYQPVVESFFKREENVWEISRVEGLDQTFPIKSLDLSLSLADLYAEVTFPPPESEE
jgi:Uma2 family endonuclease